jgi:cell division cycle 14
MKNILRDCRFDRKIPLTLSFECVAIASRSMVPCVHEIVAGTAVTMVDCATVTNGSDQSIYDTPRLWSKAQPHQPYQSDIAGPVCYPVFEHCTANIQVFVSQSGGLPMGSSLIFSAEDEWKYSPLCDDFGPLNMASTVAFVAFLESRIPICTEQGYENLVYCADSGPRSFSNAAYLLGSYLIFTTEATPDEVAQRFSGLSTELFENFRDASDSRADFRLTLIDCWGGLYRGKQLGWIGLPEADSHLWGMFDKDAYDHYGHPLNADLHEIVPGRLIAFKGPKDFYGLPYVDGDGGSRTFSPEFIAPMLLDLHVAAVVRLNAIEYDRQTFLTAGITHHELYLEDCAEPPRELVTAFLRILDSTQGVVAVHCTSGLGRSGTLIALYLMLQHRFAAEEAIAWLRIMRPGSILGEQQHFLRRVGPHLLRLSGRAGALRGPASGWAQGAFSKSLPQLATAAAADWQPDRCRSLVSEPTPLSALDLPQRRAGGLGTPSATDAGREPAAADSDPPARGGPAPPPPALTDSGRRLAGRWPFSGWGGPSQ